MASSNVPVVNLDDDDDAVPVTPPSSRNRKRSLGSGSRSPDPFSSSPPLRKRLQLAATATTTATAIDLDTPPPPRPRPSSAPRPPVHVVVDDDDTDPSLVPNDDVAETPDSVLARVGFSETPELGGPRPRYMSPGTVVPETPGFTSPRSGPPPAAHRLSSAGPAHKSSGGSSVISLDSDDDESDEALYKELAESPSDTEDQNDGTTSYGQPIPADLPHEDSTLHEESTPPDTDVGTGKKRSRGVKKQQNEEEKLNRQEAKRLKEGEEAKQVEERKKKQQEKKARKDELAEAKKKEKEIRKLESGKDALKRITAVIDTNVIESGSVGGILLNSLVDKGLKKKVTDNPIKRSILWKMEVPNDTAHPQELSSLNDGCDMKLIELPYIAIVLQAEEFCDLVNKELFFKDVQDVRAKYPTYTICYVTNRLMSHINKIDQTHFKNKTKWTPPPVEKILCKLATHYDNVHSRQCMDEAEVAEHLVGLTSSLATCKFRTVKLVTADFCIYWPQLTWLSVNANGAVVPDNFIDKALAKKDTWLKSLIAIPGVQAKCALAIWKKYPCMRSLLNVYMDPSKPVTEKELLLSDLKWEGPLSSKRLGQKCSRRVYRMLMAEDGNLYTDTAETGA